MVQCGCRFCFSMSAAMLSDKLISTFEAGIQLDDPILGIPLGGWSHGGSSPSMDLVITNNSVSPTHSIELLDNDPNNYGEWYLSPTVDLSGLVAENDVVDIQWFQ